MKKAYHIGGEDIENKGPVEDRGAGARLGPQRKRSPGQRESFESLHLRAGFRRGRDHDFAYPLLHNEKIFISAFLNLLWRR